MSTQVQIIRGLDTVDRGDNLILYSADSGCRLGRLNAAARRGMVRQARACRRMSAATRIFLFTP